MKPMYRMGILLILALLLSTGQLMAIEKPDKALGESLFKASGLGSNGKSCFSCHPNGKGLQEIGAYDDQMLKEMINFCIRDAQKGTMLPVDSQEIQSIFIYLRGLSAK